MIKPDIRRLVWDYKQTEVFKKGDIVEAALDFWSSCPPNTNKSKKITTGTVGTVIGVPFLLFDELTNDNILMIPVSWNIGNGMIGKVHENLIRHVAESFKK